MLKLGEKIINKLYLGDKAISKAYLGAKLVFQANTINFIDAVHFDGNCYVDTGIKLQSCTVETAVKYEYNNTRRMLSGWVGYNNLYWGMQTNGQFELGGGHLNSNTNLTDYTEFQIIYNITEKTATPTVDGYTNSYTITPDYSNNYTIGCSVPSSGNKVIGNVYYHRFISPDGTVIQDLRPCIDAKGVVCFYDLVTRKYFYNQGTGTLKAGGRFVTSILFDGASYINTGIAHQTCDVECTIRFEETGARQLMGFGSSSAQYWGKPANSVIVEGISGSNCTDKTDVVLNFNTDEAGVVKITRSADGKTVVGSNGASISNMPYTIGGLPLRSATDIGYWCTCEVWSNKIYVAGKLVQDLRPYVDANGVACFKDIVGGEIFYNKGTGTLTYTE